MSEPTQFKPGNRGRPKGSKNRTTPEIRTFIQDVVNLNLPKLQTDLEQMNPVNRWLTLERLMKYFIPQLSKNENENTNTGSMKIEVTYVDKPHPMNIPITNN